MNSLNRLEDQKPQFCNEAVSVPSVFPIYLYKIVVFEVWGAT